MFLCCSWQASEGSEFREGREGDDAGPGDAAVRDLAGGPARQAALVQGCQGGVREQEIRHVLPGTLSHQKFN